MDDYSPMIMKSVLWADTHSRSHHFEQSYCNEYQRSESGYSQCYTSAEGFIHSRMGHAWTHSDWGH